jgi:CRP/FNR family transcriptional activator FtrB
MGFDFIGSTAAESPGAMNAPTQSTRPRSANNMTALGPAEVPLLSCLGDAPRSRLLEQAKVQRFAAGKMIFSENERPGELQIVLTGIVDLSCRYDGREKTALLLSAGDVLMPAAALFNEPYLVAARALTATRLLMIDAESVRAEAARSPALAFEVAKVIAGQWRVALRIILDLKCRSPSQRLAAFLLRLHDAKPAGTIAEIPFSKRQLAARIGMQPETLSRTLQTLAANGLYLRGRQIVLIDRTKIDAFCGPDPYPAGDEHQLGVYAL